MLTPSDKRLLGAVLAVMIAAPAPAQLSPTPNVRGPAAKGPSARQIQPIVIPMQRKTTGLAVTCCAKAPLPRAKGE